MAEMNVNNYHFKYVENGTGEPVVFVHGSVSDYRAWDRQMEEFGRYHHAIAYSRRYHWPNEPIAENEDYPMLLHVQDLDEILKKVGEPVHLVGHSYGAFVCLLLALQSPERLKSLVMAEPPAITLFLGNPPKPSEIIRLFFTRPAAAITLTRFGAGVIGPVMKLAHRGDLEKAFEIFGKATLGEETFLKMSNEDLEQAKANLIKAEFLGSGYPALSQNKIHDIAVPTLLLSAANSPKLFHVLSERLEELMPQAETAVIPRASHIMQKDNTDVYNSTVMEFLRKHAVRKTDQQDAS